MLGNKCFDWSHGRRAMLQRPWGGKGDRTEIAKRGRMVSEAMRMDALYCAVPDDTSIKGGEGGGTPSGDMVTQCRDGNAVTFQNKIRGPLRSEFTH